MSMLYLWPTCLYVTASAGSRDWFEVRLSSGSLLVITGEMQKRWKHRIPKEHHSCKPRVNLTFRKIKKWSGLIRISLKYWKSRTKHHGYMNLVFHRDSDVFICFFFLVFFVLFLPNLTLNVTPQFEVHKINSKIDLFF